MKKVKIPLYPSIQFAPLRSQITQAERETAHIECFFDRKNVSKCEAQYKNNWGISFKLILISFCMIFPTSMRPMENMHMVPVGEQVSYLGADYQVTQQLVGHDAEGTEQMITMLEHKTKLFGQEFGTETIEITSSIANRYLHTKGKRSCSLTPFGYETIGFGLYLGYTVVKAWFQ